eukprot:TRINITY_DN3319_c0_g1_i1.p1 TRINITY_DN3319_c0_g1~~TRINITY_DN3319_c0_g1_i1.p1  ORF type:complete len:329 (+),score=63.52 TRINITY_DN3319_c0_g1_i1:1689-2675(+)
MPRCWWRPMVLTSKVASTSGMGTSARECWRVLVVNDDGAASPGIHVLARKLAERYAGRVVVKVAAPRHNQSGVGCRVTLKGKLGIRKYAIPDCPAVEALEVDGSPADCVRVGIHVLFHDVKPDLLLSGVNLGDNVAMLYWYSGTVSAAVEGAIQGIPSVALSKQLPDYTKAVNTAELELGAAVEHCFPIIDEVMRESMPQYYLLAVNVPAAIKPEYEIHLTSAGHCTLNPHFGPVTLPEDGTLGQLEIDRCVLEATDSNDPSTDLHALQEGFITVTPLRADACRGCLDNCGPTWPKLAEWSIWANAAQGCGCSGATSGTPATFTRVSK